MRTTLKLGNQYLKYRRREFIALVSIVAAFVAFYLFAQVEVRPTLGQPRIPATSPDAAHKTEAEASATSPALKSTSTLPSAGETPSALPTGKPEISLTSDSFDFGHMDPYTMGQHRFVIRNTGDGPLRLLDHRSSCKCTVGHFSREPVLPGEETEVTIQWETQANNQRFEQSATIETNAPDRRSLCFTIRGNVVVQLGADPPEFTLQSIRPGTSATATTVVSSQVWSGFSLRNIRSSLDGLTWTVEPATAEETEKLQAKSGHRLTIRLPATIPSGHFTDYLRFEVVPDDPNITPQEYEVPLRGHVLRRLAMYGPGIDHLGNVRLGVIPSRQGLKRRLTLKVYDPEVKLTLEQVDVEPDFLKVQVTPYPSQTAKGLYFLDIEVPPDSPACRYQGPTAARVALRFAHPRIHELQLRVHLAVAQQIATLP